MLRGRRSLRKKKKTFITTPLKASYTLASYPSASSTRARHPYNVILCLRIPIPSFYLASFYLSKSFYSLPLSESSSTARVSRLSLAKEMYLVPLISSSHSWLVSSAKAKLDHSRWEHLSQMTMKTLEWWVILLKVLKVIWLLNDKVTFNKNWWLDSDAIPFQFYSTTTIHESG